MSNNIEKHVVEIEKVDTEQYCLTFDPNVFKNSYDGHKWELLVKAYLNEKILSLKKSLMIQKAICTARLHQTKSR